MVLEISSVSFQDPPAFYRNIKDGYAILEEAEENQT